jgi:hypothetical protein
MRENEIGKSITGAIFFSVPIIVIILIVYTITSAGG